MKDTGIRGHLKHHYGLEGSAASLGVGLRISFYVPGPVTPVYNEDSITIHLQDSGPRKTHRAVYRDSDKDGEGHLASQARSVLTWTDHQVNLWGIAFFKEKNEARIRMEWNLKIEQKGPKSRVQSTEYVSMTWELGSLTCW